MVLALLLSNLGVGFCVKERLTRSIIDKYEFMTERMRYTLEYLFRKSDEVTAECILYDDVQESLQTQGLEEVRHIALSKYFAYIDLEYVADYCYVDNKGNVYSRSYSDVSYESVTESGFQEYLGTTIPEQNGSGRRIRCSGPTKMRFYRPVCEKPGICS